MQSETRVPQVGGQMIVRLGKPYVGNDVVNISIRILIANTYGALTECQTLINSLHTAVHLILTTTL